MRLPPPVLTGSGSEGLRPGAALSALARSPVVWFDHSRSGRGDRRVPLHELRRRWAHRRAGPLRDTGQAVHVTPPVRDAPRRAVVVLAVGVPAVDLELAAALGALADDGASGPHAALRLRDEVQVNEG